MGKRELEEGCRGEQLPCGPHYFPAVNFTCTFSHPCAVDWKEECSATQTKRSLYFSREAVNTVRGETRHMQEDIQAPAFLSSPSKACVSVTVVCGS